LIDFGVESFSVSDRFQVMTEFYGMFRRFDPIQTGGQLGSRTDEHTTTPTMYFCASNMVLAN